MPCEKWKQNSNSLSQIYFYYLNCIFFSVTSYQSISWLFWSFQHLYSKKAFFFSKRGKSVKRNAFPPWTVILLEPPYAHCTQDELNWILYKGMLLETDLKSLSGIKKLKVSSLKEKKVLLWKYLANVPKEIMKQHFQNYSISLPSQWSLQRWKVNKITDNYSNWVKKARFNFFPLTLMIFAYLFGWLYILPFSIV